MQQPDPRALIALAYSQIARGMPRDATETSRKRLLPWIRETRGLSPVSATSWSTKAVFPRPFRFRADCRGRSEPDAGRTQVLVRRAGASPAGTEWSGRSSRGQGAAIEHGHRGAISRRADLCRDRRHRQSGSVGSRAVQVHGTIRRRAGLREDHRGANRLEAEGSASGDQDSDRRQQRARYLGGTLQSRARVPGGRRVRSSRLRVRRMYHAPRRGP